MEITEKKVRETISKLRFKFPYSAKEWCQHLYMENYHCHKDTANWRVKDCAEPIENYVEVIKERGAKCLFSGDHGSQGNAFKTYELAEQNNLKYRHSAEAYWVKDRHEKDRTNCHIVIVAKNDEGRQDLNYILSVANEDGFYGQPRIDVELLLSVKPDNFIVTSACLAGFSYEDADQIWPIIANHFGKNFYYEVQCHNTDRQKELNKKILELAKRDNVQIICGLDTHYISEESRLRRENLIKYKDSGNSDEQNWYMDYPTTQIVIQRLEEQGVLNEEQILEAILNTNIFVNECEEIVFDKHFKIPNIMPEKTYEERVEWFKKHINALYRKDPNKSKEKVEGIRWEVDQFAESGTIDYPIISEAIMKRAAQLGGIQTTTARGSASSFISNNYIGLTTIDRFNSDVPLFAQRFLTKERVLSGSMPDVDTNCAEAEPFIQATKDLLGEHSCYPLLAVGTMKEKASWQLYASVNGVEPEKANQISKYIDQYNKAMANADDSEKEFIHSEDFIPAEYVDLYKKSRAYQGIVISALKHACAVLVFDGDIRREIGLMSAVSETTGERTLVVACEGKYLDNFGYVKQDFLIVDAVSLTYELFQSIGQPVPTFEELKELVKDDQATWDIYKNGITCCVNQCESVATTEKVKRYKPKNIAELTGFIAGIRPGFKSLINNYLDRKPYSIGEPALDKLLEDSAHYMLYQESIMKVLSWLGVDMGETYGVIKAISKKKLKGKKKEDLLKDLETKWLEKIGNLDNFKKVWKVIEDSASYSFNAAHAYAMAGDSLYISYFKAHYPYKFYEVAINHYQDKDKKNKVNDLIKEAKQFYKLKQGQWQFGIDNTRVTIDEETKTIYPALSSIKGIGGSVPEELYEASKLVSENDDFPAVLNILKEHTSMNKSVRAILIGLNYFNRYGDPKELFREAEIFDEFFKTKEPKKTIKDSNLEPYDLSLEDVAHLCEKVTAKQAKGFDALEVVRFIISHTPKQQATLIERLRWQFDALGQVSIVDIHAPEGMFVVEEINGKKKKRITIYSVSLGRRRDVFAWENSVKDLEAGDILKVKTFKKDFKRKPVEEDGKQVWKKTNEPEYWLKVWTKC